jgi:hypothetical protein
MPMIVELVLFKSRPGMDRAEILEDAKHTIPRWRANKELLRKHYLLDENGGEGGGLYIWPSREAAEKAHDAEWQAAVEKRTGAKPTFRYFDLLMLLDNEKGSVTEWPEPNRPVMVAAE